MEKDNSLKNSSRVNDEAQAFWSRIAVVRNQDDYDYARCDAMCGYLQKWNPTSLIKAATALRGVLSGCILSGRKAWLRTQPLLTRLGVREGW